MRKVTFAVGFATGYLLGAKAGRARYEQLMGQIRRVVGTDAVHEATQTVQTQAGQIIDTAKRVVGGKLGGTDVTSDNGAFATAGVTGGGTTGGRGVDPYPT